MPELEPFIDDWKKSGAAERANYQLFLTQLCQQLDVPQPEPTRPDVEQNAYVFERDVQFHEADGTHTTGRIDLYKRGSFVLEAKQGSEAKQAKEIAELKLLEPSQRPKHKKGTAVRGTKSWDDAMIAARGQADRYARALPAAEGWPPFLIVVDVGHSIELYSEFTRSGKDYLPFPDPVSHRIKLDDLRDDEIRERLRLVWTDPLTLDPSRRAAKVTRELAERLAELAKLLEEEGHDPGVVAKFLMRCLFTMFVEDVEISLRREEFRKLLESLLSAPENFQPAVESLWREMNSGGYSPTLKKQLLRFNGGLFAESTALPLTKPMLMLLIQAAKADWSDVEPAIFGTLLERALSSTDRHKLGAHFTPRAYVERLVMPTVIEPLREEWNAAYAAALTHARAGDIMKARRAVVDFHFKLCNTLVLDPACGTGNFLYVTLEHMKRLEGEVLNALREFGETQTLLVTGEVNPHQFLGIEINPRAAAIADLVIWIGYLQWHLRSRPEALNEPILRDYKNIECRDAVLAWDATEPLRDESGQVVTRWDGRTTKRHPVTGEEVPDEAARVEVLKYINARKAEWPKADYVVGNPPFVANRNLRGELGDGYVDALNVAFPEITQAVDLVLYFWFIGAENVGAGTLKRQGLITTSRIRLQQNQSVVYRAISNNCELIFGVPDHPWQGPDSDASVRVAMTTIARRDDQNTRRRVMLLAPDHDMPNRRGADFGELTSAELTVIERAAIPNDLSPSVSVDGAMALTAWQGLCHAGMKPYAESLIIDATQAESLFDDSTARQRHAPKYLNGRDVAQKARNVHVLDFFRVSESEIRNQFPRAYQYLFDHTREERSQERNPRLRREWWLFEANRPELRDAIRDLSRYIVTVENSPERYFVFVPTHVLPDQKLRVIASDDSFVLGVLSTRAHRILSRRMGGRHGVGNTPVYNTRCAETFPFPDCADELKARIRSLGEQLDAHRKRQQAAHPKLTLTDMYNTLEKLRAGEEFSEKDQRVHEQGLISVLRQIHDDLDAVVFEAYGWPVTLSDEEILARLVALNAERAAEEARGLIRWLRPEFQAPKSGEVQGSLKLPEEEEGESGRRGEGEKGKRGTRSAELGTKKPAGKQPWPKEQAERTRAIQTALAAAPLPVTAAELAKGFTRARAESVEDILDALFSLGLVRRVRGGKFTTVR